MARPGTPSRPERATPLSIGGIEVAAGKRARIDMRVSRLPIGTWASLPVAVLRGRYPGPGLWLSAAVHGDELNGVEVVREILPRINVRELRGTVIAVPIVNVLGFLNQDRYLPDRRDLNRSFPGSARGSLAARIAHLFMTEIVERCKYGIDVHTGSLHRTNLPQIRADLSDDETLQLARAFRAPLTIDSRVRDGSLRQAAASRGRRVLLYEVGETLRFHRPGIRLGVRGILRVMATLNMIPPARESTSRPDAPTEIVETTQWIRASAGGILLVEAEPGDKVDEGEVVARISDTFGDFERKLRAPFSGIVVGVTTNPVVNRGDAVVHLAGIR